MLIHLLSDLSRNHHNLKHRFASDPHAIFDEYDIAVEDRDILRSGDSAKIQVALSKQTVLLVQHLEEPSAPLPWPPNQVTITSYKPTKAKVGTSTKVTVKGTGFVNGMQLSFQNPIHTVNATDVIVAGATSLSGHVTFTSGQAGSYLVVVATPEGVVVSAAGFTVT